jgi:hypothetical protein
MDASVGVDVERVGDLELQRALPHPPDVLQVSRIAIEQLDDPGIPDPVPTQAVSDDTVSAVDISGPSSVS